MLVAVWRVPWPRQPVSTIVSTWEAQPANDDNVRQLKLVLSVHDSIMDAFDVSAASN